MFKEPIHGITMGNPRNRLQLRNLVYFKRFFSNYFFDPFGRYDRFRTMSGIGSIAPLALIEDHFGPIRENTKKMNLCITC